MKKGTYTIKNKHLVFNVSLMITVTVTIIGLRVIYIFLHPLFNLPFNNPLCMKKKHGMQKSRLMTSSFLSTLRPTNDVARGSIGSKEEDQVSAGDLPGIQLFIRSMGVQDKVNTGVFYHSSSLLYSTTDY
jgi:hypothetical protein